MTARQPTSNGAGGPTAQYSLQDIFDTLASSLRFEEVLNRILDITLRELAADQGSLLLVESKENPCLKMLASRGLPQEIVQRGYVRRRGSISEYVLRERRPLILNDDNPRTEHYETMSAETSTPRHIYSAMCVPLIARGHVLGTMNLNRVHRSRPFNEQDMETATIVASQAAIVIEHRALQEELLQKERLAAIGQIVAGISHCMKNVLCGVKGGMGLTEMGLQQDKRELAIQGFAVLKRNTEALSNIVLDLLDYSKERKPIRHAFQFDDVARMVESTVQFKAQSGHVTMKYTCEPGLGFYGDRDQIFRAVLNLVSNAVEACAESTCHGQPPTVEVSICQCQPPANGERPGGAIAQDLGQPWVHIEVRDNGPGIPEEVREQVWELFYSTKGSRGTGIGLAAARKTFTEHGGSIDMDSCVDQGTVFHVYMPVLEKSATQAISSGAASSGLGAEKP